MKAVNSCRSPVPLNYTEEVATVPSQFAEDTYIVKNILGHRTHRKRQLFKVRWEGYTKDRDTQEPVETLSYNKVGVPRKNLDQYGDILLFGEGRREPEAVGDRTRNVHTRRAPGLHRSRALATVYPTVHLYHR